MARHLPAPPHYRSASGLSAGQLGRLFKGASGPLNEERSAPAAAGTTDLHGKVDALHGKMDRVMGAIGCAK